MNKRHYEHTLPNIRGSLSNTYLPQAKILAFCAIGEKGSHVYTCRAIPVQVISLLYCGVQKEEKYKKSRFAVVFLF